MRKKITRRRLSVVNKLRILAEYDETTVQGQKRVILEREGIDRSQIHKWRKLKKEGKLRVEKRSAGGIPIEQVLRIPEVFKAIAEHDADYAAQMEKDPDLKAMKSRIYTQIAKEDPEGDRRSEEDDDLDKDYHNEASLVERHSKYRSKAYRQREAEKEESKKAKKEHFGAIEEWYAKHRPDEVPPTRGPRANDIIHTVPGTWDGRLTSEEIRASQPQDKWCKDSDCRYNALCGILHIHIGKKLVAVGWDPERIHPMKYWCIDPKCGYRHRRGSPHIHCSKCKTIFPALYRNRGMKSPSGLCESCYFKRRDARLKKRK